MESLLRRRIGLRSHRETTEGHDVCSIGEESEQVHKSGDEHDMINHREPFNTVKDTEYLSGLSSSSPPNFSSPWPTTPSVCLDEDLALARSAEGTSNFASGLTVSTCSQGRMLLVDSAKSDDRQELCGTANNLALAAPAHDDFYATLNGLICTVQCNQSQLTTLGSVDTSAPSSSLRSGGLAASILSTFEDAYMRPNLGDSNDPALSIASKDDSPSKEALVLSDELAVASTDAYLKTGSSRKRGRDHSSAIVAKASSMDGVLDASVARNSRLASKKRLNGLCWAFMVHLAFVTQNCREACEERSPYAQKSPCLLMLRTICSRDDLVDTYIPGMVRRAKYCRAR
ncbi:hypothetical protein FKP32DRAFT_1449258 [Trametes sanguinea]|nr:hypothetical protein FKP32DRAFT_1449258 [Trametes sanguinea]